MTLVVTTEIVDDDTLRALTSPRAGPAVERETAPGVYGLASGPFDRYERRVSVRPVDDGRTEITQSTEFELAIPFWGVLFRPLVKRALHRPEPATPGKPPWWSPPDHLDARTARALSYLCVFSMFAGYLGTLLSQTNTFFREEFGATASQVSWVLIGARFGGLVALGIVALADRRGRKKVLLLSTFLGLVLAATGALAPDLVWLGISQTAARSFSAAIGLTVAIIAVEEMPAGSRAFAVSVLTMTSALGAGGVVVFLQVAGTSPWAWRIFYLVPLVALIPTYRMGRHLHESKRFEVLELSEEQREPGTADERTEARRRRGTHLARFALLGITTFLLLAFFNAQSSYLNDYLRLEQGFAPWKISLLQVLTTLPGGLFIVLGGRLADRYGRKAVGAIGAGANAVFTVLMFNVAGWPLWAFSTLSTIFGSMAIPALGVYGPELFPTSQRGLANGGLNLLAVLGSVMGLAVVSVVHDNTGSYSPAITVLGLAPLVAVTLVLLFYPETAHRELEDINPEDQPPPPDAAGVAAIERQLAGSAAAEPETHG